LLYQLADWTGQRRSLHEICQDWSWAGAFGGRPVRAWVPLASAWERRVRPCTGMQTCSRDQRLPCPSVSPAWQAARSRTMPPIRAV